MSFDTMTPFRLFDLPTEVRINIFQQTFQGACAEIWSDQVQLRQESNIIYVCKQLYQEARVILAESMKLKIRSGSSLENIPEATRSYYFPRMQRLLLTSPKAQTGFDLRLFPSVKEVDITHEFHPPCGHKPFASFTLPFHPRVDSVHAILAGILDEKLKEADVKAHAEQFDWITQALQDPKRSCRMVVSALLYWRREDHTPLRIYGASGFLKVKYDLDTLKTVQRTARREIMACRRRTTWSAGSIENCKSVHIDGAQTWKCVSRVAYKLDESLHPELLAVKLVRV